MQNSDGFNRSCVWKSKLGLDFQSCIAMDRITSTFFLLIVPSIECFVRDELFFSHPISTFCSDFFPYIAVLSWVNLKESFSKMFQSLLNLTYIFSDLSLITSSMGWTWFCKSSEKGLDYRIYIWREDAKYYNPSMKTWLIIYSNSFNNQTLLQDNQSG